MKVSQIEPIRFTPFLANDPRAVAATTYVPSSLMRRDDSTRLGPMAEYTIMLPSQTHGTRVAWVGPQDVARITPGTTLADTRRLFPDTDALLTSMRGTAIGVRTADCLPILLYARDIQVVGAVHAGWAGTLGLIASRAVQELFDAGASPESVMVRFAPSICGMCYEVGEDLAERFESAGLGCAIVAAPRLDPLTGEEWDSSRPHIDLVKANRRILADAGIPVANFYESGLCTRHTALTLADTGGTRTLYPYHSWRRTVGTTRRNTSFVLLLPK